MRVLIDSHILLWWLTDDPRLKTSAAAAIRDEDNEVLVSIATLWELRTKESTGKLKLPIDFPRVLRGEGFGLHAITMEHTERLATLPLHHRDPFDRMLIAQAMTDGLALLSHDGHFAAYDVDLIDA